MIEDQEPISIDDALCHLSEARSCLQYFAEHGGNQQGADRLSDRLWLVERMLRTIQDEKGA